MPHARSRSPDQNTAVSVFTGSSTGPSRCGDTHRITHGVTSRATLLLLLLDVLAFYWYSRKLFMGSGNGSEGIRWSRRLPRALLTATRHRLSKALGTLLAS